MNPPSFTLYIGLRDVYDAVLIKNFQVSPKTFCLLNCQIQEGSLCGCRVKLCDWKMMTEFVLDLASCTTGRVYTVLVTQLMRGTHLYKDWTLDTTHFYCPPVTLKWKSDDLFFARSRKLHDGARGPRLGAHSVWQPADDTRTVCGSQLMRGSQTFRRLDTSHFYCPFLVCCA